MFSVAGNKALGPDGYTSVFFKRAWNVVGNDVCQAVKAFFQNGKLLQQLNHTVVSLIPKVPTPSSIMDYRPISCCNTLYKCISKIISDRMKDGLADIVSINQSAFVPGRRISDNILLTQELMHSYHRKVGPPRCAFNIDIQKAYDTVEWSFLEGTLTGFGFHTELVKWIMACVASTSFSLAINGNHFGYFKGRRGLRQGDPMSPYLFTMVMEVLTLILNKHVAISNDFRFHNKCEKQKIINLCFANDLFLFARGDHKSAGVIMATINEFRSLSGLVPSMTKSTIFFGNVTDQAKARILSIMSFEEGALPVRYLGVPLISTRLKYKDCKRLVESMEARITDWKAKYGMWCFLWSQGNNIKGKAKLRWKRVFLPRCEGGLGIRRVEDMNNALMVSHIWSLLTHRESLWAKWIHSYRIRDKSFWELPIKNNITWSWRKILQLRSNVRDYIWTKVGDGMDTKVWFDKWYEVCPVISIVTPRLIANAGFNLNSKLAKVFVNGEWRWPVDWSNRFHVLQNVHDFTLDPTCKDMIVWRTRRGIQMDFNTSTVWDDIRKLKTQDIMSCWHSSGNANYNLMCCSLCTSGLDSHDHLFFEWDYAAQMWNGVKDLAGMTSIQNTWIDIMEFLMGITNLTSASHIIAKLVVSASTYFVWNKRNRRLFSNQKRNKDQLVEMILGTVRMKLHTVWFKTSFRMAQVLQQWMLPRGLMVADDDCG
ncbi:uncharacterized protein LOC110890840 [Helianthus annuus]|uniref:uncharacterized protein LOC110890840 n=1 Tax=Helianthus annuus TaxID=4232 RepID=UPI000B8FA7DA|nr:uncharacterized protein LOC110890840 [Helianthus annuus]